MKSALQFLGHWLLSLVALLSLTVFSFAQLADNSASPAPAKLRALILSGDGSHDWRTTTPFLKQLLLDSGRFEVRVSESPAGMTAKTLAGFDLVVDDYAGPRLGGEAEKALEGFVGAGKGLVVTHGGLASFSAQTGSPGFAKLTKATYSASPAVPQFHLFKLKTGHPEHPVMQGISANPRTGDRPRLGIKLSAEAMALASTEEDEPLLFASNSGKGRVFCTALGDELGAMQEKIFITTFLRGAEWAASGKVTLPSEMGMPTPDKNGARVLVIAGGHDHEAAFYGLFQGYKDIGWVPVSDSKLAFQEDIRLKYDVLVFYDFTRDLDEKSKKNLRDFVESGKGVVVLHHGILDAQKWPWWYEEVVGGLYRLERQGTIPNSTVKFGEEHLITPAGDHPITAGISPFHVTDETYKGLYISPNVKPLLFTDNPTSDRTVAWIGPCATSKVVYIQLGHDHSPFRHPSYRALVHNSILWCAGKLK